MISFLERKKKGVVSNMVFHIYNMSIHYSKKQENGNLCSYLLSWILKNNRVCLSVLG